MVSRAKCGLAEFHFGDVERVVPPVHLRLELLEERVIKALEMFTRLHVNLILLDCKVRGWKSGIKKKGFIKTPFVPSNSPCRLGNLFIN